MNILIIGNGFVGKRCADAWSDATLIDTRVNSVQEVLALIDTHQPDVILNAAGVRGKPNVDWCETHQLETIAGNVTLPIMIAEACQSRGIYLLHIGSGCIFYGESPDPKGWKEEDFGNPSAVYSKSKYAADLALSVLPNVGIGRIRMPMDYIPSSGNIIDKLAQYSKIIDVENSLTVIEDMVAVFRQLLEKKATGIFHVTNPGSIRHRDIIALYEALVEPLPPKEWVKDEDQVALGLTQKKRSTNILQNIALTKWGITMRSVQEAARETMMKYAEMKKKGV